MLGGPSPTNGSPPLTVDVSPQPYAGIPPYRYVVDWGDGSTSGTRVEGGYGIGYLSGLNHTYRYLGNYSIVVYVTDARGAQASFSLGTVDVALPPPPRPTPSWIPVGLELSLASAAALGVVPALEVSRRRSERQMEATELVRWLEARPTWAPDDVPR